MKRILQFLVRLFSGRRRKPDVLCTGIEGQEDLAPVVLNRMASQMRDRLDAMTRDAFLGAAVPSNNPDPSGPNLSLEALDRLAQGHKEQRKDVISMIVITRLVPPGSVLLCRYEGKRYALISIEDWLKSKDSIVEREPLPEGMRFIPLVGLPVERDDALAEKILIANITAGKPNARWN